MKKKGAASAILLFIILCLSGCGAVGEKSASLSWVYGAAAALSLLLLIGCIFSVRTNRGWFLLLFSSVLVVNVGYTLLALSDGLEMALNANRIAYLGSVFLPLSMLMIILEVTQISYKKWLPVALCCLSAVVFLIAASPGILDIYYKEVSFRVIDGVASLEKVYGPLHPVYLIYLLGYFGGMVTVIFYARHKKTMDATAYAVLLSIAVFVNIGVWFIEQLAEIDFEFLSVSYIISELFLLSAHNVMNENRRLRERILQAEKEKHSRAETAASEKMMETPLAEESIDPGRIEAFRKGLAKLTPTERIIYDAYAARVTSKEIMASLNIKENTLKYHNRNIDGKLCINSRKELLEMHKYLKLTDPISQK
jgi:DNA-binding CsgD family transcriptional regulator